MKESFQILLQFFRIQVISFKVYIDMQKIKFFNINKPIKVLEIFLIQQII